MFENANHVIENKMQMLVINLSYKQNPYNDTAT